MIKPFKKVVSDRVDVTQLNDSAFETFQDITNKTILDGILLENVELNTSPLDIEHKLGRILRGYLIVRRSANAVVWDIPQAVFKDKFVRFQASAIVTVSIWVF